LLTRAELKDGRLRGRISLIIPDVGAVAGGFVGRLDLHTGELAGRIVGTSMHGPQGQRQMLGFHGCIEPWRHVNVSQWRAGEALGGFTVQVQVPRERGPCARELPPTDTFVDPSRL
jgi:hypothetical protein